ncbi:MAG TPA: NADPH:quinone reductase [Candidatus Micrarchaeaceae archaeon]|nr:NADPH:quinone reductase [Candidatus Micrarchaeaceae archaeon]
MRAIVFERFGDPEVLHLVDRPEPDPGPGEVLVRVAFSGVNPTDWKTRRGPGPGQPSEDPPFPKMVPNQDGAGTIVEVGEGVPAQRVGERVWLWEAAWQRADGTAQELVTLPARQAVPLPEGASLELGACLGIPALTAHRCLTVTEDGPRHLGPDTLAGRAVLVAGGAGAVGHAAIELARWSGAQVVTTVSSPEKAELARAAGAHHVVNYRSEDAALAVRRLFPNGVDIIVEVAPGANAELDQAVLDHRGTIVAYASDRDSVALRIRPFMVTNARYQFVLVYTEPASAKSRALEDVQMAVAAGSLKAGREAGLPLHRFPLERAAEAHRAVEENIVGKVILEI